MKNNIRPPKNFQELEALYHDNPFDEKLMDFKTVWGKIGPEIMSQYHEKETAAF